MKTRIFTITGIILLTAATFADAANHREKNRSAASCHENTTVPVSLEMVADHSNELTTSLEKWITDRENWEQEGEQMTCATGSEGSSMLYDWIAARDNWEQEGQETDGNFALEELAGMEEWIAGITEWEQK